MSYLFRTGESTINNQSIHAVDMEQALIDKLFKSYNKKLRPAGTVEVKFALNLNQIINLIEKDQIIVLNVYIDHEWTDNRLKWYLYFFILFACILIFKNFC